MHLALPRGVSPRVRLNRPPMILKMAPLRKQRGIRFAWGQRRASSLRVSEFNAPRTQRARDSPSKSSECQRPRKAGLQSTPRRDEATGPAEPQTRIAALGVAS